MSLVIILIIMWIVFCFLQISDILLNKKDKPVTESLILKSNCGGVLCVCACVPQCPDDQRSLRGALEINVFFAIIPTEINEFYIFHVL